MECITWFAPILPGKLDEWKSLDAEMNGPRREEHARSRKRMGVTREVASLVQTPQGDFVSLFHEAEDLAKAFQTLATSEDPYDVWFREHLVERARADGGDAGRAHPRPRCSSTTAPTAEGG